MDLWPWGAAAAVSLSIDDGLASPFEALLPEIEARGWRATLFIATELATEAGTWDAIRRAHARGHELGAHTHTHPNLTRLTDAEKRAEFDRAIAELQARVSPSLPLQSMAFPYEASDARVEALVWDYHRYARGGDQGVEVPSNPVPLNDARTPNFRFLQAKAPTRAYSVSQWDAWVDAAVAEGKWFIEEYHGVDGRDWEPRAMAEFRAHFDHIRAFGRKVWVAPVADVGHYIDERQTAAWKVLRWDGGGMDLLLSSAFGESHDLPLTYTFEVPADWGWAGIEVSQNGQPLRHEALGNGRFRAEGRPRGAWPILVRPSQAAPRTRR